MKCLEYTIVIQINNFVFICDLHSYHVILSHQSISTFYFLIRSGRHSVGRVLVRFWFCGVFLKDAYNVLFCTILANTNYNEE